MKTKAEFLRIMAAQTEMALATSVDNVPNVRIVNFYFSPDSNILYFATYKGNDKVKELAANEKIAFSTIPHGGKDKPPDGRACGILDAVVCSHRCAAKKLQGNFCRIGSCLIFHAIYRASNGVLYPLYKCRRTETILRLNSGSYFRDIMICSFTKLIILIKPLVLQR